MNILPLHNTKPENTKPYKDWLKSCGISNVVDEDYTMRIWETWVFKADRFGKKTPNTVLHKHFVQQQYLKQLDIDQDQARSSDVNLQVLGYQARCIYKTILPCVISEHAVRRWWQHTETKPDLIAWIGSVCAGPFQADTTEFYHPTALLLGQMVRSDCFEVSINIDSKAKSIRPGVSFRISTVLPRDILSPSQLYRWYKLKEKQDEQA